jgi:hypothetical protein
MNTKKNFISTTFVLFMEPIKIKKLNSERFARRVRTAERNPRGLSSVKRH